MGAGFSLKTILCKFSYFFLQFNMRIPSQLVKMVLDGMEFRKLALFTLEQLIEDGLIKSEGILKLDIGRMIFNRDKNRDFTFT
jgi:hypothetical protein